MVVRTRHAGLREYRASGEFGSSAIPPPGRGALSASGLVVNTENAMGVAAVASCIHHVVDTIAAMPLKVYRGVGPTRAPVPKSWQWKLLHNDPYEGGDPYSLVADMVMALETTGNYYAQKILDPAGRVSELIPIPSEYVKPKREDSGQKVFSVRVRGGKQQTYTPREILHVRGFALHAGDVEGVSPIRLYRDVLGSSQGLQEYQGAFFRNGAAPGGAIKVPGRVTEQGAREIIKVWEAEHRGVSNAFRTAVLGNGSDWVSLGVSMADAQYVESRNLNVADVCRIFRVPRELVGGTENAKFPPEKVIEIFVKFGLMPRLKMIESAFSSDLQLFGANSDLYPEFLADALLRGSTFERYQSYVAAKQAGWLSTNEIRQYENLPPVDGGDQVQITPVGGAPNEQAPGAPGGITPVEPQPAQPL